jgi:hypothetical protein
MKLTPTIKTNIIYVVALLHIVLFTYAAVSKILDFENFQAQLGQSPLLSIFAEVISVAIPGVEISLSMLLMIPKTRILAIHYSCFLMFLFTVYIFMILNFSSFVPCSCGGVLEKLGWTEHLVFNILFVLLGITAIVFSTGIRHTAKVSTIGGTIAVVTLTVLFLLSEETMHKENPFIRRFPQGTAAKIAEIDLPNNSLYIAGANKQSIYVTQRLAPLQVYEYDSNLKIKRHHTIVLERENFNYRELLLKVVYPDFYLYDGSVPIIYKGSVTDWKAKIISEGEYAFNDITFINSNQRIILGQEKNIKQNILALVKDKDSLQVLVAKSILQKQLDGIFDTGGTMQFSYEWNKFIYLYRYRNQYIVTDPDLNVEFHGKTIDTVTKAKLKIVKIKSGDTKMAAPPLVVNKTSTVINNLLMVNSMLMGRYENPEVWANATVMDVYDLNSNTYILSFYVYDENGSRMKSCFATENAFYVIIGKELQKYGYGERIKSRFKYNRIPAGNRDVDRTPVEKSRSIY